MNRFQAPKGFGTSPMKIHSRIPRKTKKYLKKKYIQMSYKFLTVNNIMGFRTYMENPEYSKFLIKYLCEISS